MFNQLNAFNNGSPMGTPILSISQANGMGINNTSMDQYNSDGWNDIAAKAAIKSAHEKVTRLMKQCRQSIEDVKTAVQMSNDRMNDISLEENALKKVASLELEITQVLALIPYGKDMYEYKVGQVNEVRVCNTR